MVRAYANAPNTTCVALCVGAGIRGYSCWAGSPPSGVVTFVKHVKRMAANPEHNMKFFLVPEPYTSKRYTGACLFLCTRHSLTFTFLDASAAPKSCTSMRAL